MIDHPEPQTVTTEPTQTVLLTEQVMAIVTDPLSLEQGTILEKSFLEVNSNFHVGLGQDRDGQELESPTREET